MPDDLHKQLKVSSAQAGVSLNWFILDILHTAMREPDKIIKRVIADVTQYDTPRKTKKEESR